MTKPLSTDGLSESYARWRASKLGRITDALEHQLIMELLGSLQGTHALDIGCGDGLLAAELSRRGAQVIGLDADADMLAIARRRAASEGLRVLLVEGRAERLPFDDASFDRVLAVTVLCFVPDAERAVAEMCRVLKPGGRLVIGELGRSSLWAAQRRIRGWLGAATWRAARFRSARELRRLIEASGLNVVEVRGAVFYPPWTVAARLLAGIDDRLGRHATIGAAFLAVSAAKDPVPSKRMVFSRRSGGL